MRHKLQSNKVKFYIGNIRDKISVDDVMNGVDYVFQAPALKQVTSCEFFPMQAVRTNVLGVENLMQIVKDLFSLKKNYYNFINACMSCIISFKGSIRLYTVNRLW